MKRSLAIVTDGSAEADALAQWLVEHGTAAVVVSALDAVDARVIADARRRVGQRVVVLHDDEKSDIAALTALEVVRDWLAELGPFERRMRGAKLVDERVGSAREGHMELERLVRRLAVPGTVKARTRPTKPARKRGRPRGSNPFRGAGLDVCVRLLLEPAATWTERKLAAATDRSPHAVHRVLAQLAERGYVETPRGAARLMRAEALRDDLARAWTERVATGRVGRAYLAPGGLSADEIVRVLRDAGSDVLLAGPSATVAPYALLGGALVLYAADDADTVLVERSFRPTRGAPDVVLWSIDLEPAIRVAPRDLDGLPATNTVITYLDLVASGIDRHVEAARALWSEAA